MMGELILGLYFVGGVGLIWGGQVIEQGGGFIDVMVFGCIVVCYVVGVLQLVC